MAELKDQLKQALTELRTEKKRKFDQTVDLIVNLQKFDVKKNPVNTFISVPHKIKDKKIAGTEVALSIASGDGKEHMALISALLNLPVGIRFAALTKDGVIDL